MAVYQSKAKKNVVISSSHQPNVTFAHRHCLEGHPLQVRHKQDFILLLSQAAVLPESDAGSDVVKPAPSFVIQNHQTLCFMWWLMYGHAVRTWSIVCSVVPHSQFNERARPHLCMNKWNCLTPVLKWLSLTQAAQDKPIPAGLALVLGTKTQPQRIFTVLCISFMICPLRSVDAKSSKVVQKIPCNWHKWASRS